MVASIDDRRAVDADVLVLVNPNNPDGRRVSRAELAAIASEFGVPLHTDAIQAVGHIPVDLGTVGVSALSLAAHKFGGPRGVGFLKCPAKGRVEPLLRGGAQEEGRRAGTENVAGVLAMLAALGDREAAARKPTTAAQWRDAFERDLLNSLPGTEIIAADASRVWNTSLVLMPEVDCRTRWVVKLDKLGVAVSTGSACAICMFGERVR